MACPQIILVVFDGICMLAMLFYPYACGITVFTVFEKITTLLLFYTYVQNLLATGHCDFLDF